jgi:hypothetical protein
MVPAEARQCPHCNQWLYEDDGSKRQGEPVGAVDFLIPRRVSGWSMLSCYMGMLGFCVPFVGLAFAVLSPVTSEPSLACFSARSAR